MTSTVEQRNAISGEPIIELEAPELTYPAFMDTDYVKLAHRLKRQQQAVERYRRKQRIKGRLITAAWSLLIVGFAAAAIVIH